MKKYLMLFLFICCLFLPVSSLAQKNTVIDTKAPLASETIILDQNKASGEDKTKSSSTITIKRFKKVDDVYHRGAKPSPEQYKELEGIGINTVIDLRLNNKNKVKELEELLSTYNLKYVSIPLNPMKAPTQEQIDKFFGIIDDPEKTPVYVHCTHGQDRTGIMSALYRVKKFNWDYDKAYAEMLSFGYHPRLYKNLKKFLKKYVEEKEIPENSSEK